MDEKTADRFEPSDVIPPMMTSAISAASSPYSMALTPRVEPALSQTAARFTSCTGKGREGFMVLAFILGTKLVPNVPSRQLHGRDAADVPLLGNGTGEEVIPMSKRR
jgi:hypothetical protein